MRISCIIPTLGRGHVLCDTVEMLLAQSYPAHEIIVVDQTEVIEDSKRERLAAWHQNGQILWLHQTEPNASKARNVGALSATGEVVLFLDDDIRMEPGLLATYAETFARTGTPAVSGQVLEGDGKTVDELPLNATDTDIGWLFFPKNYTGEFKTSFMMAGNVAIRRDVYFSVGGMDENYKRGAFREESDFAQRLVRAGHHFYYSGKCSIYHFGASLVSGGGARNWNHQGKFWYFHHCVGDWYFNLRFASWRSVLPLLASSFRAFIANRAQLKSPWIIPARFAFWLAAAPVAAQLRLRGSRLCFGASARCS